MNFKEKLAAALKAAQDIAQKAVAENRGLTDDERAAVEAKMAEADELTAQIERQEKDSEMLAKLSRMAPQESKGEEPQARSVGEHFVKSVSGQIGLLKGHPGFSVSAPEFKAATDAQDKPAVFAPLLETQDTALVRGYRRPLVTDLFGTGTMSGTSIRYYVEGSVDGGFATRTEMGQMAQLHVGDPTSVVDTVKNIGAFFNMSEIMVDDEAFWASEINNRAMYLLSVFEEQQVLNGDGTGENLLGVLKRNIGTLEYAAGTMADSIYEAATQVFQNTGISADGLIISPNDYQTLRLAKDKNDQYLAGGMFQGQYGNGGLDWQPSVWGLNTVVSPAVADGHPAVGALKQAATLYRKGGIEVSATNSDQGNFTKGIITTRITERLALAVRYPQAIVQLTPAA